MDTATHTNHTGDPVWIENSSATFLNHLTQIQNEAKSSSKETILAGERVRWLFNPISPLPLYPTPNNFWPLCPNFSLTAATRLPDQDFTLLWTLRPTRRTLTIVIKPYAFQIQDFSKIKSRKATYEYANCVTYGSERK
ncbi:hypothetical protein HNY73_002336 [Argiope bruennichi]|uniref:Uncharacterized protein n=1 Tax=Argiope bruennichi TaxID=94029 RepID=A0A8T0FVN8_ARGBR|nr:hypothetical protein HNY73_002336 [Argiope bruennichi]